MYAGLHQTCLIPACIEQIFILLFYFREQISVSKVWSVSINRMWDYSNFVRRFFMKKVIHLHLVLVLPPMLNISSCLWGSISYKYSFYWEKNDLGFNNFCISQHHSIIQQNLLQASPSRRMHSSSTIPQDCTLSSFQLTADHLSKSAVPCTSWPWG